MRRSRYQSPADRDDCHHEHREPIARINELTDQYLARQRRRNGERNRRRTENPAQRLLGHHRKAERQQQSQGRILAIEAAEQVPLDDEPDQGDGNRRGDECAGIADVIGELDGEVGTERVERTVREVDEAAQREDERQPERDQKVIRAGEQAVDDLLEDLDRDHGMPARQGARARSLSDRILGHAGIVQLLSSRVGAMTSRFWFAAGTGGDVVKISHWFLISAAGRKRIVYISCISWWSQLR